MLALAAAAASGPVSDTQRAQDLDTEYQLLAQQINRIASSAQYGNLSLLNFGNTVNGAFSFQSSSVLNNFYIAQQVALAQGPVSAADQAIAAVYGGGADGLPTGTSGTFDAAPYEGANSSAFGPAAFLVGNKATQSISVTLNTVNTIALGLEVDEVTYADHQNTDYGTEPNPGYNSSQPVSASNEPTIPANFAYWQSQHPGQALLGTVDSSVVSSKSNIASQSAAQIALTHLGSAISTITKDRANIGAYESRFDFALRVQETSLQSNDQSASVIEDADVAAVKARVSSQDVRTQASIAALTVASQLPRELLRLIQA
jgi:flagellin